ncbi:hypothetical protein [Nocardioides bizhenqiangii]|uniref:Uncharacterized protein n=1 Tax=Nocardioides bizhenqiangii TaxID=3095076 RepID=A0ABZ0ZRN8_9ACTN|nr:hypothetical protein [Nocardioides sp. HM61]WQQ26962.1 hypothetical protein SHK19_01720 [Nocardioides sp. HM61]
MMGKARRIGALAGIGLVIAVLLLSHRIGRADPTGDYRPDLPPDALATGCFPLPGGVTLDFGYQIRRDGDVEVDGELRRRLFGQYDEIDESEALEVIVADFVEAGFVASRRPAPYDAVLRKPGAGRADVVRVSVEQLSGIEEDTLVRGTFELDLPVAKASPDAPAVCSDPRATKRWDDEE